MLRLAALLLGVAVMAGWGAVVKAGVDIWTTVKPFRRWRARRQAKRLEQTSELLEYEVREGIGMKIDIGTRTSTNALVGGGLGAQIYVQLVGLLPWPEVAELLTTPEAIAFAATLFAWAVARVSRTPTEPKAI